jgi:acyl carrier protein
MSSEDIRRVISQNVELETELDRLTDDADLFEAGMSSHSSVNLMLALESTFGVVFPDDKLKPSVFRSVGSIRETVAELQGAAV